MGAAVGGVAGVGWVLEGRVMVCGFWVPACAGMTGGCDQT